MQLDMTKGRPLPVILKFTIPLIIGNVFQQLYKNTPLQFLLRLTAIVALH